MVMLVASSLGSIALPVIVDKTDPRYGNSIFTLWFPGSAWEPGAPEAPPHEAEPRGQCVPRQSLGTRSSFRFLPRLAHSSAVRRIGRAFRQVGRRPVDGQPGRVAPGNRRQAAALADFVDRGDAVLQVHLLLPPRYFLVVAGRVLAGDEEPAARIVERQQLLVDFFIPALQPWKDRLGPVLMLGRLQV